MTDWTDPAALLEARSVLGCGKVIQPPFSHVLAAFHASDCGNCLARLLAWSAAKEREACADVCRDMADRYAWVDGDAADGAFECARALRARGGAA